MAGRIDLAIRELHSRDEMTALLDVADQVWGIAPGGLVGPDFLVALAHGEGYVVGAFDARDTHQEDMLGMSFGFLARHDGQPVLHSHVTGVVPRLQNAGLGAVIKMHQREWAARRGLVAVTWTFDPLVRRNAWFNLNRLGASAVEYHANFYGPLGDDINGDDDSDRLLAYWDISPASAAVEPSDNSIDGHAITVATPDDIVALRRSDPAAAREWRISMRERLSPLLVTHDAVGVNSDGEYVLAPTRPPRM